MKKIVGMVAVMVCAGVAMAGEVRAVFSPAEKAAYASNGLDLATCTVTQAVDWAVAQTNTDLGQRLFRAHPEMPTAEREKLVQLALERRDRASVALVEEITRVAGPFLKEPWAGRIALWVGGVLTEGNWSGVQPVLQRLPLEVRMPLKAGFSEGYLKGNDRPVCSQKYLDNVVFGDGTAAGFRAYPVADLVAIILAPEPCFLAEMQQCKAEVARRSEKLAIASLRASGESFVVRNGVNPLVAVVSPVVDALNAGGCAGLELALRNLGAADVADLDRAALADVCAV